MAKDKPRTSTRTSAITIRLDPKIMEGLTELADKLGIASSTLAGLAIGEYVVKGQAAYAAPALMQEAMGKELARTLGAPMAKIFESMDSKDLFEIANNAIQDD